MGSVGSRLDRLRPAVPVVADAASRRRRVRMAGVLGACIAWGVGSLAAAPATAADPEAVLAELRDSRLELERGVAVRQVTLGAGPARLRLERGVVFPATPVAGRVVELVFLGEARLVLDPPDEVEAHQLELYTGGTSLREAVNEAVLVVARDAAVVALLERPVASGVGERERAEALFAAWKQSSERRHLNVEGAVLRDAIGDRGAEGYFAGWLHSERLGRFLYVVEPRAFEQVTLGRFEPLDLTAKELRKLGRQLHRGQRRGRFVGVEVGDLGQWNTWLSTSLRQPDRDGKDDVGASDQEAAVRIVPGDPGFEPTHYELEVEIDQPSLRGRARIALRPAGEGDRVVALELHGDLRVESAAVVGEGPVRFHQQGGEVLLLLEQPAAAGQPLAVELEYAGRAFDTVELLGRETAVLADTLSWYPHAGELDLATYDVTLRWPKRLDLLASGEEIAAGVEGDRRWERRRVSLPTKGFTFELGRFATFSREAGHVEVTLGVDALSQELLDDAEVLLEYVVDALLYLEAAYGPLPLDQLTVVTSPRDYSQAMLGFVTLSTVMMVDDVLFALLGSEDPRTVIAHELAHQWWGHRVTWHSYRDQWISEALANYSAVLYARERLGARSLIWSGPTTDWRLELLSLSESGYRVEALGPVTLGARLDSSLSAFAYQAVVYKKGAMVLDMLARRVGEENFRSLLRWLTDNVAQQALSTETFLEVVARWAEVDLEPFAHRFVYGTGLPLVDYTYAFEPKDDGSWRIRGELLRRPPARIRFRVVERGDGLDVMRVAEVETAEPEPIPLVVPVQITTFDPQAQPEATGKKGERQLEEWRTRGNRVQKGYLLFDSERMPLEFNLPHEPKGLVVDPADEVLATFRDATRNRKEMLLSEGRELAGRNRHREAESALLGVLAAEADDDASWPPAARDGEALLELARLELDRARVEAAERHLEAARRGLRRLDPQVRTILDFEADVIASRLALHRGEPRRAVEHLVKPLIVREIADDAEALLVLAVAARQLGEEQILEQALAKLATRPAQVVGLQKLTKAQ